MRLESRTKLHIDTKMHLHIITLEPDATSLRERTGLLNLRNLQEPEVELASPILSATRHRKLDVVDSQDLHAHPPPLASND